MGGLTLALGISRAVERITALGDNPLKPELGSFARTLCRQIRGSRSDVRKCD
jgi:hypothetical protein